MVPWAQLQGLPGDPEGRVPFQEQDPLVLGLVVEDRIGLGAAQDALDPDRPAAQQRIEDLPDLGHLQALEQIVRACSHGETSSGLAVADRESGNRNRKGAKEDAKDAKGFSGFTHADPGKKPFAPFPNSTSSH